MLLIFMRLMSGKKVNKYELMEKFDKKESTVQRDIAKIESLLEDEVYGMVSKEKMRIERDGKGNYQLLKGNGHLLNNELTDMEVLMVLKILVSTRIMTQTEMKNITSKLIGISDDQGRLKKAIANELLHYKEISDEALTDKVTLISDAIVNNQLVEFEYTKNNETKTFQRIPSSIYFLDLYFFMISASETAQDDREFEMLNKFRINNMKNLRVLSSNHKTKYIDKFEAGILRNQTNLPFLGNPIKMVIDFYYDPVYVLNRFPNAKIIKVNEDDSFRIEMNVNDGYGTKMWLSSQSHMVKVISPKHMRDYLIQDMLETLKLYEIELL
ncbi:helix-turn-helix transcriptional regulator [Vagococcus fluvialis]